MCLWNYYFENDKTLTGQTKTMRSIWWRLRGRNITTRSTIRLCRAALCLFLLLLLLLLLTSREIILQPSLDAIVFFNTPYTRTADTGACCRVLCIENNIILHGRDDDAHTDTPRRDERRGTTVVSRTSRRPSAARKQKRSVHGLRTKVTVQPTDLWPTRICSTLWRYDRQHWTASRISTWRTGIHDNNNNKLLKTTQFKLCLVSLHTITLDTLLQSAWIRETWFIIWSQII